jgi:hypothetical protein
MIEEIQHARFEKSFSATFRYLVLRSLAEMGYLTDEQVKAMSLFGPQTAKSDMTTG